MDVYAKMKELGITLRVEEAVTEVTHAYPDITVHLTLYGATIAEGTPQLLEHSELRWITLAEAGEYEFCPADAQMLRTLRKRA